MAANDLLATSRLAGYISRRLVPAIALGFGGVAQAATITVNSTLDEVMSSPGDGNCTLREAINNANNNTDNSGGDCAADADDDDIVFDPALLGATITMAGTDNHFEITETVSITGDVSNPVTIDGNDANRHFLLSAGQLDVLGLTLQNGRAPDAYDAGGSIAAAPGTVLNVLSSTLQNNTAGLSSGSPYGYYGGGAIFANDAEVMIAGSTLTGNESSAGGAGLFGYSNVEITQSNIDNNQAVIGGGIAAVYSELDISTSTITNNGIEGNPPLFGGGLALICNETQLRFSTVSGNTAAFTGGGIADFGDDYVDGDCGANPGLTIQDSRILDNTADYGDSYYNFARGGGVAVLAGTDVTISRSQIVNNRASVGGGLFSGDATVRIDDSLIQLNRAESGYLSTGGGIFSYAYASLTVVGSTISGNIADGPGGGIAQRVASMDLTNTTLSDNEAAYGGGIAAYDGGNTVRLTHTTVTGNSAAPGSSGLLIRDETLYLHNSLIALNPGGDCSSSGSAFIATGNSMDSDGSCVMASGGMSGVTEETEADLNLGDLADNGGPTPTHALLTTPDPSVAIDGVTAMSGECPPPDQDQRNAGRPQGLACDIGAYEAGASLLQLSNRSIGFRNALATDTNVVTLDVEVSAPATNAADVRLTQLRGYYTGTGSPLDLADGDPIKVWLDENENGVVDGSDTELTLAGFTVDDTGLPEFIVTVTSVMAGGVDVTVFEPGDSRRFLTTFDFDGALDYASIGTMPVPAAPPGTGWMQSAWAGGSQTMDPNTPRYPTLIALAALFTLGMLLSGFLPNRYGLKLRRSLFVGAFALSLMGGCPGRGRDDDDNHGDLGDGGVARPTFQLNLSEAQAQDTGMDPKSAPVRGLPAATPFLGAEVRVTP